VPNFRTAVQAGRNGDGGVLIRSLRELQQADFLRRVAEVEWGEGAQPEAKQWDDAELAASLDPWEPQP